jgi:hypothetical protein
MISVKQIERKILKRNRKARDDDKLLTLRVWQEYELYLTDDQQKKFMQAPSMDIITRRRRELKTEFPFSPEEERRRFKHFIGFRDEFSAFTDPELLYALQQEDRPFEPPSSSRWYNKMLRKKGIKE